MAIDAFLYFEGGEPAVEGETTDQGFKSNKAFEINSYSFGVENIATIGSKSGGGGAGKANFDNFEFVKNIDKGSLAIFSNCCKGGHVREAFLALRRAGGQKTIEPYLVFHFKFCFFTSVKWSGSGDDVPEETITFAFGCMEINYWKQNSAGVRQNPPTTIQWSQIVNQPNMEVA